MWPCPWLFKIAQFHLSASRKWTRYEHGKNLWKKLLANLPCRYDGQLSLNQHKTLKPWPDEDASWKLGSTGHFVWPGLARTWVDLRSLWSRSNLHPSQSKFFTVWPPKTRFSPFGHLTQVNAASWVTSINLLLANRIRKCLPWNGFIYDLRELVRKLACPFGHPTPSLYASSTCRYLRVLASPFGQGLRGCRIFGDLDQLKSKDTIQKNDVYRFLYNIYSAVVYTIK